MTEILHTTSTIELESKIFESCYTAKIVKKYHSRNKLLNYNFI